MERPQAVHSCVCGDVCVCKELGLLRLVEGVGVFGPADVDVGAWELILSHLFNARFEKKAAGREKWSSRCYSFLGVSHRLSEPDLWRESRA